MPSPKDFTNAMRALAGNCSVIALGEGDARTGMVVTSAVSLSAEPPMILACVSRSASSWEVLRAQGRFGWSALGAGHQQIAERFSGPRAVARTERFNGASWAESRPGVWLLDGAPIAFDCDVDDMYDRGTHSIVIGRVREIRQTRDTGTLIYWHGRFHALR